MRSDKIEKILKYLKAKRTANECIQKIFDEDVLTGAVSTRSWKYYVHLNKLFAPLERAGLIHKVGTKIGPTNREEKIWKRCATSSN